MVPLERIISTSVAISKEVELIAVSTGAGTVLVIQHLDQRDGGCRADLVELDDLREVSGVKTDLLIELEAGGNRLAGSRRVASNEGHHAGRVGDDVVDSLRFQNPIDSDQHRA